MLKLGLPSRTCWINSQPIQLIDKNSETLLADSLKNKESKKNNTQFRARMRENRLKQCNVFIKQGCLVEPVESVPNQFNRLIKILKIYHNIPRRIRNPTKKKWRSIPSQDEGESVETMQCVYKTELPSRTYWTSSQLVQSIEKNSETLASDSSKNKESNKKTALNSEPRWGRTDQNNVMYL